MTEHELQTAILELLKYKRCYALRINSGKIQNMQTGSWVQLCERGTPDIITSLPGGGWGCCEVKSSTGTLSPEQITTLRRIDSLGLNWLVADDLSDVERWLIEPAYHGKERHIKRVKEGFAYSTIPKTKKSTITSNQFYEWERHNRKM
jgi:hypothetical protein